MDALIAVCSCYFVRGRSVLVVLDFGAVGIPHRFDGECDKVDFEDRGRYGSLLGGGVRAVEDDESPYMVEGCNVHRVVV